jgi:hypothetical protein
MTRVVGYKFIDVSVKAALVIIKSFEYRSILKEEIKHFPEIDNEGGVIGFSQTIRKFLRNYKASHNHQKKAMFNDIFCTSNCICHFYHKVFRRKDKFNDRST